MAHSFGSVDLRVQSIFPDSPTVDPLDFGTLTVDVGPDGVIAKDFTDRLALAVAAFGAVMNAEVDT